MTTPFSISLNTNNIQKINNQQLKSTALQHPTTSQLITASQPIATSQHTTTSNIISSTDNDNIKNINSNQVILSSSIMVKRQNSQNKVIPQRASIVNEMIINSMTSPINQTNQRTSFVAQQ